MTGQPVLDPAIALLTAIWIITTTVKEVAMSGEELLWPRDAVCVHQIDAVAEAAR